MQLQEATAPGAQVVPVVRKGNGKAHATVYARIGQYKVRATIECDDSAYGNKFGGVSVWDKNGLTWNRVYGLNDGVVVPLQSGSGPTEPRSTEPSAFVEDMTVLIDAARAILL